MSSNYLRLVPTDPNFVPAEQAQHKAQAIFASYVPQAYQVSCQVFENVIFVDAGNNFECARCPSCGVILNHDWWINEMDKAFQTNFSELTISTPCCGILYSLNDLQYEWPMGFARFIIEAIDPDVDIQENQIHELELILECTLRKIWAHY